MFISEQSVVAQHFGEKVQHRMRGKVALNHLFVLYRGVLEKPLDLHRLVLVGTSDFTENPTAQ